MSTPEYNNLPTQLGDYTLTHHIGQQGQSHLYRAKQSHVERGVIVEVLNTGISEETTAIFLENVRAKVAARIPHVCQVFEALTEDGVWYMTQAHPEGKNLVQLQQEGTQLTPIQLCMIAESVAALYTHTTGHNLAAGPLYAHSIFLKGDNVISFLSPVLSGEPTEEHTHVQMTALAGILTENLPPQGTPGRSRLEVLIDWMANGYEGTRIDWSAVAHTASTIRKQLTPKLSIKNVAGVQNKTAGAVVREIQRNRKKSNTNLIIAGVGGAICLFAFGAGFIMAPKTPEALPANDGTNILCKYGSKEFDVSAKPISIKEYREFLRDIKNEKKVPREQLLRLRNGIPGGYLNFTPAHWSEQWKAANEGGRFNNSAVTIDSPVRGISYWDALLYARYHGAELPDAKLLQTARAQDNSDPAVCEWTTTECASTNLLPKSSILLPDYNGNGSIMEPDREAKNLRYGFRIAKPTTSKK